jgi:hypothetical protein
MLYEISLPQSKKLNVNSTKKVIRLHKMNGIKGMKSAVDSIIAFYSKNSKSIYLELFELEDLQAIYNLRYKNIGSVYRYKEQDLEKLSVYKEAFRAYEVKIIIDKCDLKELITTIKTLAEYNVEIELTYDLVSKLTPEDWEVVTSEIILDSEIVQKVEPFFSMAYYQYQKTKGQKTAATLWKVFGDSVGERLYITEDGDIALSKRWSDKDRYFGYLGDKADIHDSPFFEELSKHEQNIFFTNMNCAMCDHFVYCKAYMKYENSEYDCEAFKKSLDEIGKNLEQYKKVA